MGHDLSGGFSLNNWEYCLSLAWTFGWTPEGTEAPNHVFWNADGTEAGRRVVPPDQWDGNYTTNDFQWVRTSDALALSRALYRALDAFRLGAADLTSEQADALNELQQDDALGVEELARYAAQRAYKGGFAVF